MGSTAQTTTARQLASFDSGAFVGSSWSRPATATSPCSTVGRFAGELIHGRREPTWTCYKGRSSDSSEHPGSFTPSFSYPLSRQSKRGGRLQPLRSARPPPRPGQFRRTKTSPALPNATVRLHLNPRSCLASQTQLGTTMAGIPKSTEASPPPRSSPPATPSTPGDPTTTGRTA